MPASFSCLGPLRGHVADRGAALEVGVLGDQPRALEHVLEVPLGEPLALGDHAEAVRARRLGGPGVLEDLLGLHHRVHRRLRLREPRLRAEAAVLGAAAGLCVHQRAHVRGVAEALLARRATRGRRAHRSRRGPRSRRAERFFAGDQRRQAGGPTGSGTPRKVCGAADGRGRAAAPARATQLTAAGRRAAAGSGSAQNPSALNPCEPRPNAWLKRPR